MIAKPKEIKTKRDYIGAIACFLIVTTGCSTASAGDITVAPATLPTASSTLVPTVMQDLTGLTTCINPEPVSPQSMLGSGTLVLGNPSEGGELNELSSGTQVALPTSWHWYDWEVSPDGGRLAHYINDGSSGQMEFMTPEAGERKTFAWQRDWTFAGWVDSEHVKIGVLPRPDTFTYSTTIILDVATGQQSQLAIGPVSVLSPVPKYWPLVYDPSLTRVIYPDYSDPNYTFALEDISTREVLARIPSALMEVNEPKWSPVGSRAAIVGYQHNSRNNAELFGVTPDGQVGQWTQLETSISMAGIGQYSWSRDGQKIAFWLQPHTKDMGIEEYLAVLDVSTKQVANYCIPGLIPQGGAEAPLWAPDSQELAVQSYEKDNPNQWKVLVLELSNNRVATIGENLEAAFWSSTTPAVWLNQP